MIFHLAEFNVARMKAPLDDPRMAEFVRLLPAVNAAADSSPGFVWRLQTDDGDATGIRAYEDPLMLVNLSVWESIESLKHYTYYSLHATPFRLRKEWFEPLNGPSMVLWSRKDTCRRSKKEWIDWKIFCARDRRRWHSLLKNISPLLKTCRKTQYAKSTFHGCPFLSLDFGAVEIYYSPIQGVFYVQPNERLGTWGSWTVPATNDFRL